jgi:hypothetical protein
VSSSERKAHPLAPHDAKEVAISPAPEMTGWNMRRAYLLAFLKLTTKEAEAQLGVSDGGNGC